MYKYNRLQDSYARDETDLEFIKTCYEKFISNELVITHWTKEPEQFKTGSPVSKIQ